MPTVSLLPVVVDLEMVQGTDNLVEFTLTDGTDPVDITNDTVELLVKTGFGGTEKIAESNAPGSHSDPEAGKTQFLFSKEALVHTSTAVPTSWVYEIRRVISGSGDEVVYMRGDVLLTPAL